MKKCFAGNRPVLKNGEAKIYKDNLELVLQRHIHNLHNSSVNGMQAVINSAYIIENTLLKIREILETHSPETRINLHTSMRRLRYADYSFGGISEGTDDEVF